jgi:hypothetical protein
MTEPLWRSRVPVAQLLAPPFTDRPRALPAPEVGVVRAGGQLLVVVKAAYTIEPRSGEGPLRLTRLAPAQDRLSLGEEGDPGSSDLAPAGQKTRVVEVGAGGAPPTRRGEVARTAASAAALLELGGDAPFALQLPATFPCGAVVERRGDEREIELGLDAVVIDRARGVATLLFRGQAVALDVLRLVIHWQERDAPRPWDEVRLDLPRAHFAWAVEEADLRGAAANPVADEELCLAQYATWGQSPPAPVLPLERYAGAAAELAEARDPRPDVLSRYALDEYLWTLEEWGWMDRIAREALEGDTSLAERYAACFAAEQDRLATPSELSTSLEVYVDIKVALERADDPLRVLKGWAMTLSEWMRLDRRWTQQADSNPEIARELSRLESAARAASDDEHEDQD